MQVMKDSPFVTAFAVLNKKGWGQAVMLLEILAYLSDLMPTMLLRSELPSTITKDEAPSSISEFD